MWVFWETNNKLERVTGGKSKVLQCSNCKKAATFHECKSAETVKLYAVLDVWKNCKRLMQCANCRAVADFYAIFPEERTAEDAAEIERKHQIEITKQKQAEARREQEELLKQRQAAQEAKRRREAEMRQQADAQNVDDELEKIKRDLGRS